MIYQRPLVVDVRDENRKENLTKILFYLPLTRQESYIYFFDHFDAMKHLGEGLATQWLRRVPHWGIGDA